MIQDKASSDENHQRFIERVLANLTVWGLKSEDGWAVCSSNEYEETDVMPFWSDEAYARRAAKGEWENYIAAKIPLDEFIDGWLKGMHEEGVLVGTNWDAGLSGKEIEAIALAEALTKG